MTRPNTLLNRLDAIGRSLAQSPGALALIGLGSVGREMERLDEYSDLDFFVVVAAGHKQAFLSDLAWLSAAHPLTYRFRNTDDGYKFLFADGIYGEMAVFTPDELLTAAYAPGRLVWRRAGVPDEWAAPRQWPPHRAKRSIDFLLGEALTNLYVGLCRYHRGEKLSALRFIQGYAVDRVIDLAGPLTGGAAGAEDLFDGPRRFEQRFPMLAADLPALLPGYDHSPAAAAAILALLEAHFPVEPAFGDAIRDLLSGPAASDAQITSVTK